MAWDKEFAVMMKYTIMNKGKNKKAKSLHKKLAMIDSTLSVKIIKLFFKY